MRDGRVRPLDAGRLPERVHRAGDLHPPSHRVQGADSGLSGRAAQCTDRWRFGGRWADDGRYGRFRIPGVVAVAWRGWVAQSGAELPRYAGDDAAVCQSSAIDTPPTDVSAGSRTAGWLWPAAVIVLVLTFAGFGWLVWRHRTTD